MAVRTFLFSVGWDETGVSQGASGLMDTGILPSTTELFYESGGFSAETDATDCGSVWIAGTSKSVFGGEIIPPTLNEGDQYCKVQIKDATGTARSPSALVRADATNNDCYGAADDGTNIEIYKFDAGTYSQLATASGSASNDDWIEIESEGTALRAAVTNGGVSELVPDVSTTDSSFSTGDVGALTRDGAVTAAPSGDTVEGGSLGVFGPIEARADTAVTAFGTSLFRSDIKVQRFSVAFGASADTADTTIDAVNTQFAFARILGNQISSAGENNTSNLDANTDDLGCTIEITSTTNVRLTRETTGKNADYLVYFEVWEYVGTGGINGGNAFQVVLQENISVGSGATSATGGTVAISPENPDNVVPIVTGQRCAAVGKNNSELLHTVEFDVDLEEMTVRRGDSGSAATVSVVAVEFVGPNWTVQNVAHTFTNAGTNNAVNHNNTAITASTDWDHAFIFSSFRTNGADDGLDDCGWNVWPHDSTATQVYFRKRSGSATDGVVEAWTVHNENVDVEHRDSITGAGTAHGTSDHTTNAGFNIPVAGINADRWAAIATSDCAGTGTAYARQHWGYFVNTGSGTDVTFQRSYNGQPGDWAAQRILFPDVRIESDNAMQADTATVAFDVDVIRTATAAPQANPAETREPREDTKETIEFTAATGSVTTNYSTVRSPIASNGFEVGTLGSAELVTNLVVGGDVWVPTTSLNDSGVGVSAYGDDWFTAVKVDLIGALSPSVIVFGTTFGYLLTIQAGPSLGQPASLIELWAYDQAGSYVSYATGPSGQLTIGDEIRARVVDPGTLTTDFEAGVNGYSALSFTADTSPVAALGPYGGVIAFIRLVGGVDSYRYGELVGSNTRGQLIHVKFTDTGVFASTATADIDGTKISIEKSFEIQAERATVSIDADLIHSAGDLEPATQRATASIDATLITSEGTIVANADTATVATDLDLIHVATAAPTADTATAAIDAAFTRATSLALQAATATVATDADLIHVTSVAVQAETATVAFAVEVVSGVDVAVQADTATVAIDADFILPTSVTAQADTATTAIDGTVAISTDLAAQADTATVATDADLLHVTSVAVQAETATAAIDATVVQNQATIDAQADTATAAIAGTVVHVATAAPQADTASTVYDADLIHVTATAAQADTATADIEGGPAGAGVVAAAANDATTVFDADLIHVTSLAVAAGEATVALDADLVHPTALALQAATATVATDADLLHVTSLALAADTATADVDATKALPATIVAQAATATVTTSLDLIHVTAMAVQADTATVVFDIVSGINPATIVANADTATVALDADLVHVSTISAQADTATVAFDVEIVSGPTAEVAAQADTATTTFDADLIHPTSMAVVASTATTTFDVDVGLNAANAAAQADTATVSIDADLIRVSTISAQAAVATVATDADLLHVSTVNAQTDVATAALVGVFVHETSTAVSAATATVATALDLIHPATVNAVSPTATADLSGETLTAGFISGQASTATVAVDNDLVHPTTIAADADTATTVFETTSTITGTVAAQASTAATSFDADLVHLSTVVADAETATAALDADRIDYDGVVVAQADTATVAISADLLHVTDLAASADLATVATALDLIHPSVIAAQADTATADLNAVEANEASVAAQAATATVALAVDLIHVATSASQADTATADLTGDIATAGQVTAQAGTATTTITGQIFRAAVIDAQADTATTDIQVSLQFQIAVAAQAATATTLFDVDLIHEGVIVAQANPVYVVIFDYAFSATFGQEARPLIAGSGDNFNGIIRVDRQPRIVQDEAARPRIIRGPNPDPRQVIFDDGKR